MFRTTESCFQIGAEFLSGTHRPPWLMSQLIQLDVFESKSIRYSAGDRRLP
ncbi:MAG: hypothetical protein QF367_08445 [Acidimicrobiales bacterium]|nr:hypothetical protein [Actinomycetes bacterium]MDP7125274.1 hypothetical protein [Acidimicrobiales bacterium]